MLTHDRSKRIVASLCHESLRYILYIIWGSLTNLKIAFFLHQKYTKLHHSKVWNIQTREMNAAFSSQNVTGLIYRAVPPHILYEWSGMITKRKLSSKTISTSISNPFSLPLSMPAVIYIQLLGKTFTL